MFCHIPINKIHKFIAFLYICIYSLSILLCFSSSAIRLFLLHKNLRDGFALLIERERIVLT